MCLENGGYRLAGCTQKTDGEAMKAERDLILAAIRFANALMLCDINKTAEFAAEQHILDELDDFVDTARAYESQRDYMERNRNVT